MERFNNCVTSAIIVFVLLGGGMDAWGCENSQMGGDCINSPANYSAEEMFQIGIGYSTGEGNRQDSLKAVYWMKLAATQGHRYAQFNLGEAYINGYGVAQDYREGVKWLKRAAERGLADAQVSLGLKYDDGIGIERDPQTAVRWFSAAAKQGNGDGQNNLGIAYATGVGVAKDYSYAFAWFELASSAGHPLSGKYLNHIKQGMSSEQIAVANRIIKKLMFDTKSN